MLIRLKFAISLACLDSLLRLVICDDSMPMPMSDLMPNQQPEMDLSKISSRNYGNTAESSNQYYATYTGYPSYGVQSSTYPEQFNPSNYYPYYNPPPEKSKPSPPPPSPTYPTYPTSFYPAGYGSIECTDQMVGGIISDVLPNTGINGFGILRPVVAAITAAILTKIPIILAIKALIVKLILVPLGFIVLSLPVILPIVLLFFPLWTRLKESIVGTTTPAPSPAQMMVMVPANSTNTAGAKARTMTYGQDVFTAFIESDKCFEKLACSLGSRDADTPFIRPISLLLKMLQTFRFVQNNIEIRNALKRYRDAYMQGVSAATKFISETNSTTADMEELCTDQIYPCSTPTLYSRPEFVGFSRYL